MEKMSQNVLRLLHEATLGKFKGRDGVVVTMTAPSTSCETNVLLKLKEVLELTEAQERNVKKEWGAAGVNEEFDEGKFNTAMKLMSAVDEGPQAADRS